MNDEFPPNSHQDREARPARQRFEHPSEKKEVARVTKGKAVVRKRPLYKKFIDAFRPEDNVGFVEYTLIDVLVPGIKDAVSGAATDAIENVLGTSTGRRRRRRGEGGYTSYNRMSEARPRSRRDRDDDDRRDRRREPAHGRSDHREYILDSRVEAEEVLDSLNEIASKYDSANMRDLCSLIGETPNPTDEDWGWYDLRGSRIHRIGRDSYLLDLPRPVYLD